MKKTLTLVLALALCLSLAACGGSSSSAPASAPAPAAPSAAAPVSTPAPAPAPEPEGWKPSQNIEWFVTSSPGGGSDIYTRMISDIMTKDKLVDKTFLVTNKTDGGGEVGRAQIQQIKAGKQADHTLLTFNSGDLMPMVKNTPNRIDGFTPIAVMAVDKQLLFKGEMTKYKTFADAIAAAKAGTPVVIGGSKGDDIATYEKMLEVVGLTETQMPYITSDSTGDAITSILGGHIEFVISKPAASSEYVEAGKLVPVLAFSTERYTGNLADAPKLSEIGDYVDVEVPVWRGVVGPKSMSPEAAAFWSKALKAVSESEAWKTNYIAKNKLIPNYMDQETAAKYMADYQANYMATEGIK
ncbi:MAG: tripartite tricarboxylate transporter substrate-binding protein [Oscillospiraceae bacterium]